MAELLIRVGTQDAALIERVLVGPQRRRPDRLVVDAHVAQRDSRIQRAARSAGVPLLIDPQTFYWQDSQHPADPWAALPFGRHAQMNPADFTPTTTNELVRSTLQFQLAHGATALVLTYVHIDRVGDGWAAVQQDLWEASKEFLHASDVQLPVLAVVAAGWRLLSAGPWGNELAPILATVGQVQPLELALAASRVDGGLHRDARLGTLVSTVERLSGLAPVIAWQQGVLGELSVAAGAIGYECGMGWRERCDTRASMAQHRGPSSGHGPRPVYVSELGRSVPKRVLDSISRNPRLAAEVTCPDPSCCPSGREALLGDMRAHGITARKTTLEQLGSASSISWRWQQLTTSAQRSLALGTRINLHQQRNGERGRVDTELLGAIFAVATKQRQIAARRRAA